MLSLLLAIPAFAAPVDYATQVQPIFAAHCVQCHGSAKQKAGLRLESGANALRGGLNGPVVLVKKSKDSPLIRALHGEGEQGQMPPKGPLTADEIQLIARWIDEGAVIPATESAAKHWAFEAPRQASVPAGVQPIDYFLSQERQKNGISAAPPAEPEILVRRLHLDLTGLPPTPDEVRGFTADMYEQRVDALLASPAYGERWGRHLLDIWRYSDWYGYGNELRNSQKNIWNWRDWVVESLNENKPYDAMIREMLAGDELRPLDDKAVRATGYLARSYYKFNRNVWLDDIVEHTGKAFLGITLNCCRCHNHMYDPFSQEEYFRFRAIFEPHQIRIDGNDASGIPRVYDADLKAATYVFERGDDKRPIKDRPLAPGVPAALGSAPFAPAEIQLSADVAHPTLRDAVRDDLVQRGRQAIDAAKAEPRRRAAWLQLRAVQAKLNADRARYARPVAAGAGELIRHAVALHLEAQLLSAEADASEAAEALGKLEAAAKKDNKAITAAKAKRDKLAKAVEAATHALEKPLADYPPLVTQYPDQSTGRRLALANWITHPANPLTARVFVNHLWMRHFGRPLVPTVFDFGKNGRPPTHAALLDWLAVEFVKSNWDVKKMHRLMVTSAAYRMRSSFVNEENQRRDPDNLLLGRMNSRPLEAEAIRDSLLQVAGLLDPARGGPELDFNDEAPKPRRSLYYRHAPEKMMPFLMAFDNPSPTECYRRPATVVPQQAMALVNSKLSARAAQQVSQSLPGEPKALVEAAYMRILSRQPTADEERLCIEYLAGHTPASLVQALFNHADFTTIR